MQDTPASRRSIDNLMMQGARVISTDFNCSIVVCLVFVCFFVVLLMSETC